METTIEDWFSLKSSLARYIWDLIVFLKDLGERATYDVKDLKTPRMGEWGYYVFIKLANTWPLGRLILWKIKRDSDFGVVEKFATKVTDQPLFSPVQRPTQADIDLAAISKKHSNLDDFLQYAEANTPGPCGDRTGRFAPARLL